MTQNNKRVFQLSSDMFWGYRVQIDMFLFDDVSAIIQYIKQDMKTFFLSRNLQLLAEKVEKLKFHIHHPFDTYKDLVGRTNAQDIIYICDNC
jgi:hypothetical protein